MKRLLLALPLLLAPALPVQAQVGVEIGISLPGVRIGIDMPAYPELQRVPGHPVYYAPQASGNYFFYDGLYWVYAQDEWYQSSWYNGPWQQVAPQWVPAFVLRIPVRYYRQPPNYFRGWNANAPPRWSEHWGRDWADRRDGWDRWDRRSAPAPAPLPVYQRGYRGEQYPQAVDQQRSIRDDRYRYRPREQITRQHFEQQRSTGPATPMVRPAPPTPPQPIHATPPTRIERQERGPERGAQPGRGPERQQGDDRGSDRGNDRGHDRGNDKDKGGRSDDRGSDRRH